MASPDSGTPTVFDLIVIGLGPGGEDVAGAMARAGRSVLGVDKHLVGGECPYYGCIPSKMILRGAEVLAEARRVPGLAGETSVRPDFAPVHERIRDEATDDWDDVAAVKRLTDAGATFVRGTAALAGRDDGGRLKVTVDGTTYSADRVLLATGTAPALPDIDGVAELRERRPGVDGPIWTNREAVKATAAPARLAVLGGGPIACELAQGFQRFGSAVTIIDNGDRLLPREEPDASQVLLDVFERDGITVRRDAETTKVAETDDGLEISFDDGTTIAADILLVAAGRIPNLAHLGLDTVGLDPAARSVEVDEHMRAITDGAPVEGLFAIGDIAGHGQFTHVAVWQAKVLEAHLLGKDEPYDGYHALAWATFTDPEVGHVGMTEQQARDAGLTVRTGVAQIASDTRGWIHGAGNDGFVKLVEDADAGVLVGGTVVGPSGGEILASVTLAVHAKVPVRTLRSMFFVFPTLHRTVLEALQAIE